MTSDTSSQSPQRFGKCQTQIVHKTAENTILVVSSYSRAQGNCSESTRNASQVAAHNPTSTYKEPSDIEVSKVARVEEEPLHWVKGQHSIFGRGWTGQSLVVLKNQTSAVGRGFGGLNV